MRNGTRIRCTVEFKENLEKLYPNIKSFRLRTEKLNEELEALLYGTKKKGKH